MAKKVISDDIRINKFISETGFCSRRDADQLIADARVTINGKLATLGSRVAEGDKVKVDGEPLYFIPMEQRERKLRRYGSSRRKTQDESGVLEGPQATQPNRRERVKDDRANKSLTEHKRAQQRGGEEFKRSATKKDKTVSTRGKASSGRASVGKTVSRSASIAGRGKSKGIKH